jgi:hypothetical protein
MSLLAIAAVAAGCGEDRHYVDGRTQRLVDRSLGQIQKACGAKTSVSVRTQVRYRRAIETYVELTRRRPDDWIRSGFADNADTTLRYTLAAWADSFASGRCPDKADAGSYLVAAAAKFALHEAQTRRQTALN